MGENTDHKKGGHMTRKSITTRIDSDLIHQLRIYAAEQEIKVNFCIETAIKEYLGNRKRTKERNAQVTLGQR